MNIDPKVLFWLGLIVSVALAIANGTIAFKGAVPDSIIPYLTTWCAIVGNIGTIVMTAIAGSNMTKSSRLAAVEQVPLADRAQHIVDDKDVQTLVLKNQGLADSIPSTRVIGPDQVKK
jgi:hypothetical protein